MQEPFTTLHSTAVPFPAENIDTDQIIPARFLKATGKEGFGKLLFYDWRYDREGQPKTAFVLNNPAYRGEILIGGKNFGCGSSREHAAWAIRGAGFRVVVSNYFADIFRNNALNNHILPVQVSDCFLHSLLEAVARNPDTRISVNLPEQRIAFNGTSEPFEINPYKKECLLKGYDDVDYLLEMLPQIEQYEQQQTPCP